MYLICYVRPESPMHKALFWVEVSILQLDEKSLYASCLALLEQNLHTLNCQNTFEAQSLQHAGQRPPNSPLGDPPIALSETPR